MTDIDPAKADEVVDSETDNSVDVEQLVWMLLDEQISDEQFQSLEKLLREEAHARSTYVKCVQLHTDLSGYYSRQSDGDAPVTKRSPVLGFLSPATPATDTNLPQRDN